MLSERFPAEESMLHNKSTHVYVLNVHVQCRHLIPALNVRAAWAKYTNACPIATQFPGHGCMDDLTTKRSFDSQTTWVIDMQGKTILKCVFMDVYTTRHRRASGRLVHELNVCTVGQRAKIKSLLVCKPIRSSMVVVSCSLQWRRTRSQLWSHYEEML